VDVYDYDPANYVRQPVMLSGDAAEAGFDSEPELTPEERVRRYVFLANFKWEDRKGWDVLLGAYWDAFGPGAPPELRGRTTLVIKTKFEATFARGVTCENVVRFIEAWGMLGSLQGMRSMKDFPHVVLLCGQMSTTQVTQLYANADAFVFPSKAEGWGLPATEAMAMALPVLITEWGGLRRFITPDTCFRIPLDGLEEIEPGSPYGYEQGMKMAVPSRAKTAELMRYVLQHPEHARRVGRRARALIAREMSEEAVADRMDQLFSQAVMRAAHGS
jgi:glycosyltransferase involved in cell wall biosynthesis